MVAERVARLLYLPSGIIMSDTLSTTTPTEKTDKLVPIDTDKEPIVWDNNRATIEGVLDEVHKFHLKTDQFVDLTQHRAVPLPSGKLAIDNMQAHPFVQGVLNDPRSFKDPLRGSEE